MEESSPSSGNAAESQESLDRVPESPPMYTQENSQGQPDDIEAQISKNEVLSKDTVKNTDTVVIKYDNENTARSSKEDGKACRKASDVIIDMECVEMEEIFENDDTESSNDPNAVEFPDEDDALLLRAAENIIEQPVDPPENLEELESSGVSESVVELNPQLKADDEKRRKIVEKFRKFKPLEKIFPDVRCSEHNTVAFIVKPNYTPGDVLEPNPPNCIYKWEPKFIQMPYCHENVVYIKCRVPPPEQEAQAEKDDRKTKDVPTTGNLDAEEKDIPAPTRKLHLWQRIEDTLTNEKILCSQDFLTVLKRYCRINSEFKALDYCTEQVMTALERTHFFNKVVPFMVSLILRTKEIVTCPIPFLKKNLNHNISLTQQQVACLLSNAFFSTFPRRFKCQQDTPSINFKELFIEEDERKIAVKAEKIRCIINYFTRIESDMPMGVVTYSRKNLRHSNMPDWSKLDKSLTKLVPLLQGTIEDDSDGMIKVDFANSNLGGGVLGRGAVQEEILFVIYPELILARLFTEKLNFNEAVIVTGCERFSKYKGYARNLKYDGDYQDTTPYDSKGRRCTQIVAIDALYISRPTFQYHPRHILRELNKAYVGFSSPISSPVAIATGKWGCGAFNGDPQLKTIIQLLAASHAGRDVVLYTFEDVPCLNDILSILDSIGDMKIKDVWNLLRQYHSLFCTGGNKISLSLKDFCRRYADGQSWVVAQEESKRSQPSTSRHKQIPITQFYSSQKRYGGPPDDATVAAITNGINKINSPIKYSSSSGKRLRDEEGLTEKEIHQQLLSDCNKEEEPLEPKNKSPVETPTEEGNDAESSPKSPKRPKRLVDFYPNNSKEDTT